MFYKNGHVNLVSSKSLKQANAFKQMLHELPCESTKYSVVKEFQCFFVLRDGESKSWLMTCICNWLQTKFFTVIKSIKRAAAKNKITAQPGWRVRTVVHFITISVIAAILYLNLNLLSSFACSPPVLKADEMASLIWCMEQKRKNKEKQKLSSSEVTVRVIVHEGSPGGVFYDFTCLS